MCLGCWHSSVQQGIRILPRRLPVNVRVPILYSLSVVRLAFDGGCSGAQACANDQLGNPVQSDSTKTSILVDDRLLPYTRRIWHTMSRAREPSAHRAGVAAAVLRGASPGHLGHDRPGREIAKNQRRSHPNIAPALPINQQKQWNGSRSHRATVEEPMEVKRQTRWRKSGVRDKRHMGIPSFPLNRSQTLL